MPSVSARFDGDESGIRNSVIPRRTNCPWTRGDRSVLTRLECIAHTYNDS